MASGHVELTLGKEGSTYGNLTSTVPVTSSDFTRVAVSLEKSDSKLHVMVGHTHTSVELVDYYALKVRGLLLLSLVVVVVVVVVVGWLLNLPAACKCVSGTDLL